MRLFFFTFTIAVLGAAFFLFLFPRTIIILPALSGGNAVAGGSAAESLPPIPEAQQVSGSLPHTPVVSRDIPNQQQLANPPAIVKGIYLTGWSAGSNAKINSVVNLVRKTELNAVVIDVKDYSGNLSYETDVPEIAAVGGEKELRISQPNMVIKKLHDANIYVIARVTAFQDPILAKAHPEWALEDKISGKVWTDRKGLAWMDPAAKPVWNYIVSIAKDALSRGFDEVNFDYVRFASDGDLGQITYPFWDQKTPRHAVIRNFFKYLRENLPNAKLSADLFGLATVNSDDLGIGQVIEDAYKYFDAVSPMVYPSHYAPGFLGYKSPAKYPYEVVKYSMEKALAKIRGYGVKMSVNSSSTIATGTEAEVAVDSLPAVRAKLRPWLQDFNLGANYDATMVRKQIQATYDALLNATSSRPENFGGWLLWNPSNIYTEGALGKK